MTEQLAGPLVRRVLRHPSGVPAPNVSVTITDVGRGATATLYSDEDLSTTKANPVTSDSEGIISFYAVPGEYSFSASGVQSLENVEIQGVSGRAERVQPVDNTRHTPSAALYETIPRIQAGSNGSPLSTGRLTMVGIWIPKGTVVTNISFLSATTAAGTPLNQVFGLYNSSRVKLGQSADDTTTAWAASTLKTLALAAPYTTTYSGLHYLGISVVASTVPTLRGASLHASVTGLVPIISGNADSGLTDTLPATAAAITSQADLPYAYVS